MKQTKKQRDYKGMAYKSLRSRRGGIKFVSLIKKVGNSWVQFVNCEGKNFTAKGSTISDAIDNMNEILKTNIHE